MSIKRVRNGIDFSDILKTSIKEFNIARNLYQKRLSHLDKTVLHSATKYVNDEGDTANGLEIHARKYFADKVIQALNWNLEIDKEINEQNMDIEMGVKSTERGTRRFMDYYGTERGTDRPLFVIETKNPDIKLPETDGSKDAYDLGLTILKIIQGVEIEGNWKKDLYSLRDYIRSVKNETKVTPTRAMMTNGRWMIVFLDPEETFCDSNNAVGEKILVYKDQTEIIANAHDIFKKLNYYNLTNDMPDILPAEIKGYVKPEEVKSVLMGLLMINSSISSPPGKRKTIELIPMLFILNKRDCFIPVIDFRMKIFVPENTLFSDRIIETGQKKHELLIDTNNYLGFPPTSIPITITLTDYFKDKGIYPLVKLVKKIGIDSTYRIVTGDNHFIQNNVLSIADCQYHDYSFSQVLPNIDEYRESASIFPKEYLCTCDDIIAQKKKPVDDPIVKEMMFNDSGFNDTHNQSVSCKLYEIEKYLCCRSCIYEYICEEEGMIKLKCKE